MLAREIELAPDTPIASASRRVDRLRRVTARLELLIRNLLDASQLIEGRLPLVWGPTDFAEIVRDVVERLAERAVRAHCSVELDVPPSLAGVSDPSRFDQIVTNLLDNAIKFGAGHPVQVSLAEREGRAILSVVDRGPGISREDQIRIFERFERGTASAGVEGLGLGLWIVRAIVRALEGRIEIDSELGRGTTMRVELPLKGGA